MTNLKTNHKYLIQLLTICLFFSNSTSAESKIVDTFKHYANKLDKFLMEKSNQIIEYRFGQENASAETQLFVDGIAKEMGFDKQIKVKKYNTEIFAKIGYHNALAMGQDYVYINERFFNKLSVEAKRFLIGHEITHLQKGHLDERGYLLAAAGAASLYGIYKTLETPKTFMNRYNNKLGDKQELYSNSKGLKNYIPRAAWALGTIGLNGLMYLYLVKICRQQEYEADREAAIKLNAALGGVSFLDILKTLEAIPTNADKNLLEKFSTHPLCENRIAELQKLINYQNLANK